ncbi:MAG TPA: lipid A export permease/ATP-binding protein MsbA [Candidatus Brocadiia bacterium]|nr:lipid A export permease/ATP-binding protein MsbA [Candidatus Brocadiales bacterium]
MECSYHVAANCINTVNALQKYVMKKTLDIKGFHAFKRLLKYVHRYWFRMLLAVVFMGIISALDGVTAFLVKPVIDDLFLSKKVLILILLPIAIVCIYGLKGICDFWQNYLVNYVGSRVVTKLRDQLYKHIQTLSLSYFTNNSTGYITSRVIHDTGEVWRSITTSIPDMVKQGFTIIALTAVAFYRDWKMACVAIIILPLASVLITKIGRKIKKLSKKRMHTTGNLSTLVNEGISGIKIVKAFCTEDYEHERFANENEKLFTLSMKATKVSSLSSPIIEIFGGITTAAIIAYGGSTVISGSSTPGEFFSFMIAIFLLYRPVKQLGKTSYAIQNGIGAAERIFQLMDTEPEVKEKTNAPELQPIRQSIEFKDVCFKYHHKLVLQDINLKVNPGEIVAIVGTSGVGKTTLVNLIPRFYDVTAGSILFDGIDIRNATLHSLRKQIAIVTQQTILFNDTVRNNIAYGSIEKPDEDVIRAAKIANAHRFVEELPSGYATLIGENGVKLSGGQQQRISIARAVLKDAPILILDEATSSLDAESEREVQNALDHLMENRTTFVIAHRLSTIKNADRIIVLQDGKIVEEGTHEELIQHGKEYKKLYELQFTEQKPRLQDMVFANGEQ